MSPPPNSTPQTFRRDTPHISQPGPYVSTGQVSCCPKKSAWIPLQNVEGRARRKPEESQPQLAPHSAPGTRNRWRSDRLDAARAEFPFRARMIPSPAKNAPSSAVGSCAPMPARSWRQHTEPRLKGRLRCWASLQNENNGWDPELTQMGEVCWPKSRRARMRLLSSGFVQEDCVASQLHNETALRKR